MHGQPTWSYLYRKMIPPLVTAGMRVIAPDLPGYGKSDKPAVREDYTYQRQVDWMGQWLEQCDFSGITFFGQDWGGLIGLRMIVDRPERFDRVVISNTGLPYNPDLPEEVVQQVKAFRADAKTPTLLEMSQALQDVPDAQAAAFAYWQKFCWETEDLPVGFMMSMSMERLPRWRVAPRFLLNSLGLAPLRSSSPLGIAYIRRQSRSGARFENASQLAGCLVRSASCYVPRTLNAPIYTLLSSGADSTNWRKSSGTICCRISASHISFTTGSSINPRMNLLRLSHISFGSNPSSKRDHCA
jgi:pimeloyl-ACP methyl ester carboxylesterase